MATLVMGIGGFVGSGGNPIGGMLGATAGAVLDAKYLFPYLEKRKKERPVIADIDLAVGIEGSPIHYCIGPNTKAPGTPIWISDIKPIEKWDQLFYFVDIAVAVCRGEINAVKRIWADADLIYDGRNLNRSAAASTLSVVRFTIKYHGTFFVGMQIISPPGGPDLTEFAAGIDVTTSGFANGGNNGTFLCHSVHLNAVTNETSMFLVNSACVTEAAGASVTITQTITDPRDPNRSTAIRVHLGTAAQTNDAILPISPIAAAHPAYRNTAYVVIENLALEPYGNRVPNLSFEVEAEATKTVGAAIGDIIENTGLVAGDYDVTEVSI